MNAHPFLVVGESLADIVRTRDGGRTAQAGGSLMNVAFGVARLGHPVCLVTELGQDAYAELIRTHLQSADVEVQAHLVAKTASATATLDLAGAADYEFEIAWTIPPIEVPAGTHHVHAGSIAAYLAPGADTVEGILSAARDRATVSFDPNIRPLLVQDRRDALRRTERLVRLSDVVKASDEDLRWLYPGRDLVEVAHDWLNRGPAVVTVTSGGEGAFAISRAGVVRAKAARVDVADTVGAGDSFMAAMLDALDSRRLLGAERRLELDAIQLETLAAVTERAILAAAITVSRRGANPPSAAELAGMDNPTGRPALTVPQVT
ncbi:carbohydrate kinase [Cellulomonas sp. ATA003]|uniref:carbohydrate kinase family protein n=1 Tax=Cellulomonas sp. ATA003 TaxID=3073064 RepID=UPI002872F9D3|nr:carbohydrate kinase [Cellulomonas sp. ATA003]WNB87320.1 carbohydrate kinase [Cellulomonas sp. ATA003]